MSRLLLAVAVAAILLLVGAFVPVNGKTLVDRWNASSARPSSKGAPARVTPVARQSRPPGTAPEKVVPEPVEHHTDADRDALDRIVAEHAADRPAPPR
jgi:hypothetical protein